LQLQPQPLRGLLTILLHDGCKQFTQDCYPTASRLRFEPGPFCARVQHANHSASEPHICVLNVWSSATRLCRYALARPSYKSSFGTSKEANETSHNRLGVLPSSSAADAAPVGRVNKACLDDQARSIISVRARRVHAAAPCSCEYRISAFLQTLTNGSRPV